MSEKLPRPIATDKTFQHGTLHSIQGSRVSDHGPLVSG